MSRFKDLRLNRGFTQGKLAKELGTSQQTISRIEYKDELVPTDILIRASKYFNVSVDYILGLSDEKHNHTCEQRLYRHLEEYEDMVMEYAALKPEYQEAVKRVIRTFSEAQDDVVPISEGLQENEYLDT